MNNITTAVNEYDVIMDGDGSVLNAANNWWGDTSGPGGVAPGLGDTVGPDVTYTPFLTAPASPCAEPVKPVEPAKPAAPTGSTVPSGPSAGDHARAQAPLCADLNGTTSPIVRADVPGGTVPNGGVFCRIINENGSYRPASGAAEIGSAAVISRGVLQAVDIFGQAGGTSVPRFSYPVRVCLMGSGSFLFLDALTQPRALSELPASLENGYTCATIPNAGTVILVGGTPAISAPSAPTGTALTSCMVTTNYLLNLRATPSDSAAIITQVPYNVTLTATERQGDWFHVNNLGTSGWLNAAYVVPSAGCS